jgi:hypothetical protein
MKIYKKIVSELIKGYYFLFVYETDVAKKVFKQAYAGLNYLAILAIIGQTYFFIYDYVLESWIGLLCRGIIIISCLVYLLLKQKFENINFDGSKILVIIFFTLDIETQIRSENMPFYDPLTWIILPILILFHSFYFNGVPGNFFLYWLMLVIYYYIRVAMSPVSAFYDHRLVSITIYLFFFWLFAGFFNLFWFRVRYTNLMYLEELEHETKKRIEIEKELSAQKERATIFYNLHDHMGSAISDLNIQFNSLSTDTPPSKEELDSIQFSLRGIDDNLRMQINAFQDRKILEADFFNGLRIILFRRYAIYKREIHIYLNDINSSDSILFQNQITVWNLYSLCMEFCNNDLKYGYGTCKWNWEKKENNLLQLEITSRTKYDPTKQPAGIGRETIEQRLKTLGANMKILSEGNLYHVQLRFTTMING